MNEPYRHRFVLSCWLLLIAARPAAAEKYGNSLDWVPADASVYSTSLRLKDQLDALLGSNAWKAFKKMPAVEQGWAMAEAQINNPEGPAAMFWQLMELPENKQLVDVLGEMVSEEIVFYAGEDFSKLVELIGVIQGSRLAPMIEAIENAQSQLLGGPVAIGANGNAARLEMIIEAIEEDPSLLDVPQMVFAFRIKDGDAAQTQLARLEVFANLALDQTGLDAKVEREELGDAEYLVLELDGSMIDWGEDDEELDERFQNLKEIISEKELTVALGVWNDYVILSLGASNEHLSALGKGPLLAEQKEFEALKPHLKKKPAAIQYVSRELMRWQYITPEDLDDGAVFLSTALEEDENLPDEVKERLEEDLSALAEDLRPYLVTPGAMASCTLFTDNGFESFTYNWTPQPRLDGSQPLEITQHLGGSPILAVAARGTHNPEDYELLAKWLGKGLEYFEEFALEHLDEDERQETKEALELARPLLKRLDKTTRDHLIPALADGQSAIVIDADIKSRKWHDDMPESHAALPMAELAIVVGVSDAEEFKRAMAEYKAIADDAVDAIREKHPDAIPEEYEIPEPETRSTSDGALYEWAFADEVDLDEQITLCGAVSDHVAAIASSARLAERVLSETPLDIDAPAANGDKSRAVVAGINFAELIAAIAPWMEYGVRVNMLGEDAASQDLDDDPKEIQSICEQVRTGSEILQCFRGAWSETHEEDGVWVTHTVAIFEDLDE